VGPATTAVSAFHSPGCYLRGAKGRRDSVCSDQEFTVHGAELLSEALPKGMPQRIGYSPDLLLTYLPTMGKTLGLNPLDLHKVLAFDAWVGNGDRRLAWAQSSWTPRSCALV
jgi:hypothetical protein